MKSKKYLKPSIIEIVVFLMFNKGYRRWPLILDLNRENKISEIKLNKLLTKMRVWSVFYFTNDLSEVIKSLLPGRRRRKWLLAMIN